MQDRHFQIASNGPARGPLSAESRSPTALVTLNLGSAGGALGTYLDYLPSGAKNAEIARCINGLQWRAVQQTKARPSDPEATECPRALLYPLPC